MNELFPAACYAAYVLAVSLLVWWIARKISQWREVTRQMEVERRLGYKLDGRGQPDWMKGLDQ